MKLYLVLSLLAAMAGGSAHAAIVNTNQTLQLGKLEKISLPTCRTDVSLLRVDGVLKVSVNGGPSCRNVSFNGRAPHRLPKAMFLGIMGQWFDLGEKDGENFWTVTVSDEQGNGDSFDVENTSQQDLDAPGALDLVGHSAANLRQCGGVISVEKSILAEVTLRFAGLELCNKIAILTVDGRAVGTDLGTLTGNLGNLNGSVAIPAELSGRALIVKVYGLQNTYDGLILTKDLVNLKLN